MVIRIAVYSDRLGQSGKFVENCTKLNCLETTGYHINCSAVLWLVELQIRRGRQFQTQVRNVKCGPGISVGIATELRAGRSGD